MNEQPLLKEENLLIIKELEAQPFATQRHLSTKRCGLCFIQAAVEWRPKWNF